jgi:hypothetical protein
MGLTGMVFGRTLRKALASGAAASILSAISLAGFGQERIEQASCAG